MNDTQYQLSTCLSTVIRQRSVPNFEKFDLSSLMAEAKAHDVSGLIYKGLKDQVDLQAYQRDIIFQILTQSRYYQQSLQIIQVLQESGIQVILLKGAVLKMLYPLPELRTMGDLDILVPEAQLGQVHDCLTTIGYTKRHSHNEKHDVYDGEGFHLEIHWSLVNASRQSGHEQFETKLWQHLQAVEINGVIYQTLSDEDFLVHLLLHAAGHMKSSGFGIRQLCDITLWIEQKPTLDYHQVKARLRELKIETFSQYALAACQHLLRLEIPTMFNKNNINEEILQTFIETVFNNGVHGHREKENQFGHYFAYGQHKQHVWQIGLQCLFPSIRDLSRRYTYAHRYHFLLPIAWIHRFFRVLLDPFFSSKQKLTFLTKTPKVAHQKAVLLQGLDLSE